MSSLPIATLYGGTPRSTVLRSRQSGLARMQRDCIAPRRNTDPDPKPTATATSGSFHESNRGHPHRMAPVLSWCDFSPPRKNRRTKWKHEREPSHQLPFVYVVRSHIVPDLGSLPRTRINLSMTGYTDKDTHATPMRRQTTRPIVIPVIYWQIIAFNPETTLWSRSPETRQSKACSRCWFKNCYMLRPCFP